MNNNRVTVLACIDGSTFAQSVVDYASWASRSVNAPLKLLHNIDHREWSPLSDLSGNLAPGAHEELLEQLAELEGKRSKILLEQGKQMLAEACSRAEADDAVEPTTLQRHGALIDTLIELEDEIRVAVLGVRSESHDDAETQIGVQLESVIRTMHRPVMVVNRAFSRPPTSCMLAYDGSQAARKALEMVAKSPLYHGMECHLVHVSKDDQSPVLDEAASMLGNAGIKLISTSLHGNVEQKLLDYQQQHDIELIVMGAFGHSRLRELLFGSVTHRMLASAAVPLLLLR